MGRRPRRETPDGIVHVTARGNRRQHIYTDAIDHRRFEADVADACDRFEVRCLAYCEMRNHFHLLLFGAQTEVSRAMHRINGCYAQWFNRRHGLDGHLFQDRFHGAAVTSDVHLMLLFRYILMNPVRAGICASPADWRWSSYRATVGLERAPGFLDVAWVLDLFDPLPARAPATFTAFVADDPEALLRLAA